MNKSGQIYSAILVVCLFISIFIIFNTFSVWRNNSEGESPIASNSGWSGGVIIQYNEFYAPHADASKKIDWWFASFPSNVSLIVMIMRNFYYTEFLDLERTYGLNATVFDFYFETFIVAESNNNSGEMDLYYEDHWYVVFINLDDDMEASQLEFRVNFDVYEQEYFYINPIASIYMVYGVVISLIIIGLIIRTIRKRVILNKPAPVPPYPYIPKKQQQPVSPNSYIEKEKIQNIEPEGSIPKYCPYCGEYMDRDAIFCHQCGNKF
ncbi:MAG: hypothetical protein ACFE85_06965 [Candidatus Hodarchaeota archaeon]